MKSTVFLSRIGRIRFILSGVDSPDLRIIDKLVLTTQRSFPPIKRRIPRSASILFGGVPFILATPTDPSDIATSA